jgi:hypothetical protein
LEGSRLKASLGKSSQDLILTNKKLGVVVCACYPSYAGSINSRIKVQAGPSIKLRPYSKVNQSKKGWVAQVVERLPSKLSSNSLCIIPKKQNKTKSTSSLIQTPDTLGDIPGPEPWRQNQRSSGF